MTARADVKVGFACNNRCVFCAQGRKRDEAPRLARERVIAALAEGRRRADRVVLTGGEPTIRPDLVDLVVAARDLGYREIQVQTNGRMLAYRRYCEALVAAGVTELSPSVHGHEAALHDALTRAPGSFAQTLRGVRNLVAMGVPVITNTVITRANLPHLRAIAAMLCDLRVTQMQLAWVHPVGAALERFGEVVPGPGDLAPHLGEALDLARARGARCLTEAVPYCLLGGRDWAAAERVMPTTVVYDLGGRVDFEAWRRGEGKAHGPPCARCAWRDRCEGPWREVPERLGWNGFEPRSD